MLAQQNVDRNSWRDEVMIAQEKDKDLRELRLYQMRLKMEAKSLSERLWSSYAMVSPSEMDDQDRNIYHAICDRLQEVKRLIRQVESYLATV